MNCNQKIISILGFMVLLYSSFFAQEKIEFRNPSFEGLAHAGAPYNNYEGPVQHWFDYGTQLFPKESPVDVHPVGAWTVTTQPTHGNTFVGMVCRDNSTVEAIGQKLSTLLEANVTYNFTIDICRSENYQSRSNASIKVENFIKPTSFCVYGTSDLETTGEPLYISDPIDNIEWKTLDVEITPKKEVTFLIFATYYSNNLGPYNGHVLIDNLNQSDSTQNIIEFQNVVVISSPNTKNIIKEDQPVRVEQVKTSYKGPVKKVKVRKPYHHFRYTPPKFVAKSEKYLVRVAHREGAVFEERFLEIIRQDGQKAHRIIPATFDTIIKTVTLDKKRKINIDIEVYKLVTKAYLEEFYIPALAIRHSYYALIKDGEGEAVPAEYRSYDIRKMVRKARMKKYKLPAEYRSFPVYEDK